MDFRFVELNIIGTLVLNQFFFSFFKKRPRFIRLLVFFNLLGGFALFEKIRFVRLIYFIYIFLRGRSLVKNLMICKGRHIERKCRICISLRGVDLVEVLYNLISLVLSRVDVFFLIYKKAIKEKVLSSCYKLKCSGFVFRLNDLRGVFFFDRSSVFFNWNEVVSFFFFLVGRSCWRSEQLVLF